MSLAAEPQLVLTADPPLLVNGVPRKQKGLKPADRIRFGAYVLEFQEISIRTRNHPPPRPPAFGWPATGIAALLILSVLFGMFGLRPAPPQPPSASVPPAAVERPARTAIETASAGRQAPQRSAPAAAVRASRPPPALKETRMTRPGEKPEFFPADILFFHAHPDDESLAFGALMAAASRAGKRLAVVLFTDGEAGKDRYPNRPVGGRYPDHALRAAQLADVRVQEARSALSLLGCEAYVRLGLKNHPYNRSTDELSLIHI